MPTVNLRDLYPTFYTHDEFIDISDEIAEMLLADKRWEAARVWRMYRYKAQYSLDCNDGIENAIITFPETPYEACEQKELQQILKAALKELPKNSVAESLHFTLRG